MCAVTVATAFSRASMAMLPVSAAIFTIVSTSTPEDVIDTTNILNSLTRTTLPIELSPDENGEIEEYSFNG